MLALEKVQKRFARIIPGMITLMYEECLIDLGLYSLEFRRIRGDHNEIYQIMKVLDRVDVGSIFPVVGESRSRRYRLRIKGHTLRKEIRRNPFRQ